MAYKIGYTSVKTMEYKLNKENIIKFLEDFATPWGQKTKIKSIIFLGKEHGGGNKIDKRFQLALLYLNGKVDEDEIHNNKDIEKNGNRKIKPIKRWEVHLSKIINPNRNKNDSYDIVYNKCSTFELRPCSRTKSSKYGLTEDWEKFFEKNVNINDLNIKDIWDQRIEKYRKYIDDWSNSKTKRVLILIGNGLDKQLFNKKIKYFKPCDKNNLRIIKIYQPSYWDSKLNTKNDKVYKLIKEWTKC